MQKVKREAKLRRERGQSNPSRRLSYPSALSLIAAEGDSYGFAALNQLKNDRVWKPKLLDVLIAMILIYPQKQLLISFHSRYEGSTRAQ